MKTSKKKAGGKMGRSKNHASTDSISNKSMAERRVIVIKLMLNVECARLAR